jgi:imidazole glycerol-phosphate synthase subunit HisH
VIALIDYGAGNLASVRKALRECGAAVLDPASPPDLERASAIVLPGVGHFAATNALDDGWRAAIRKRLEAGVPFLGICLGMQWLFDGSDEAPSVPGLGLLPGRVTRLPELAADGSRIKIPHVGWNAARSRPESPPVPGLRDGAYFYFTHAYAAPVTDATAAVTSYGAEFASAVRRANVCGVQFHPEKSGADGLAVLRAFAGGVR